MKDKIKQILKAKKWTQTRLAKYIGISVQRLNNWLHKPYTPGEEWIEEKINQMYNKLEKQNSLQCKEKGGNL